MICRQLTGVLKAWRRLFADDDALISRSYFLSAEISASKERRGNAQQFLTPRYYFPRLLAPPPALTAQPISITYTAKSSRHDAILNAAARKKMMMMIRARDIDYTSISTHWPAGERGHEQLAFLPPTSINAIACFARRLIILTFATPSDWFSKCEAAFLACY